MLKISLIEPLIDNVKVCTNDLEQWPLKVEQFQNIYVMIKTFIKFFKAASFPRVLVFQMDGRPAQVAISVSVEASG